MAQPVRADREPALGAEPADDVVDRRASQTVAFAGPIEIDEQRAGLGPTGLEPGGKGGPGRLEQGLHDAMLARLRERGLLKARGRQRTDSTHVLAAVRAVNRLESMGETLRAALNALASVAPAWLAQHADAEWPDRYGRPFE